MKNKLLWTIIVAMLCSTNLFSQTEKGKFLVGLSSNFNVAGSSSSLLTLKYSSVKSKSDRDGFSEPDPDKKWKINFSPKCGYFIIDNLAVGLDIDLALGKTTDGENDDSYRKESLYASGPFIRYYFTSSKIYPYIELNGKYGNMNIEIKDGYGYLEETDMAYWSVAGGFGLGLPITQRVFFDVFLGYCHSQRDNNFKIEQPRSYDAFDIDTETTINTFGVEIGFFVTIGSLNKQE